MNKQEIKAQHVTKYTDGILVNDYIALHVGEGFAGSCVTFSKEQAKEVIEKIQKATEK